LVSRGATGGNGAWSRNLDKNPLIEETALN
jgi:hypothetical protein